VKIAVTGSPSGMHDGADVTATLIYTQLSDVVVIPSTAVHRASTGERYVDKVVDGKTVQTTVEVGISSGLQTQIVSGLAAGDQIVVPQLQLSGSGSGGRGGSSTGGEVPGGFRGGGEFTGRGGSSTGGGGFPGGGFPGGGFPGGGFPGGGGQGG
jgi:hypothetical protein